MSLTPLTKPGTPTPELDEKYVMSYTNALHTKLSQLITEYNDNTGKTDSTDIQTAFSVPTVGMAIVNITCARYDFYARETINVDTTNATTFWNDIRNWLFANNFFDIVFDVDKYKVNDPDNLSYVMISI